MGDLTVAIPFFNAQQTLAVAIESVLMQTYTDLRLLLVNDGSTDQSVQIARAFAKLDDRIEIVDDGRHRGLSETLNLITARVTTPLIARMDADDVMHPDRLMKQVEFLESHPAVDVVGTDIFLVDSNYRVVRRLDTRTVVRCRRFTCLHPFNPTITGRTAWFRNYPYSSEFPRCEDVELWMRAGGGDNIQRLREPLLFYNRFGTKDVGKILASLSDQRRIMVRYRHKLCLRCFVVESIKLYVSSAYYLGVKTVPALWRLALKDVMGDDERRGAQQVLDRIVARSTRTGAVTQSHV